MRDRARPAPASDLLSTGSLPTTWARSRGGRGAIVRDGEILASEGSCVTSSSSSECTVRVEAGGPRSPDEAGRGSSRDIPDQRTSADGIARRGRRRPRDPDRAPRVREHDPRPPDIGIASCGAAQRFAEARPSRASLGRALNRGSDGGGGSGSGAAGNGGAGDGAPGSDLDPRAAIASATRPAIGPPPRARPPQGNGISPIPRRISHPTGRHVP